jgi:hypothetical protein
MLVVVRDGHFSGQNRYLKIIVMEASKSAIRLGTLRQWATMKNVSTAGLTTASWIDYGRSQ